MREIAAGQGRTFDDIDGVRGWLARHDLCTGKIGVIGFCMGGAYAVALAPGPRLRGRQRQLRRLPEGGRAGPGRRLPDRGQLQRQGPLADGPQRRAPAGESAHRARGRP